MTIDENGIVLQANRASLEILDPIPRQLVGREVDECIPGLRQLMLTQLSEIRDGIKYQKFDLSYQSPVAEKLILEIAASPLPTDSLISGWIITFQDLTRVRRLEFQMRQSEKMAAVGSLAAGIAHEIRNPLASISGSIQLLGSSFSSRQEDEQRLMKIVLREIDRLNNLITEFLDFVRPDTMKDDPVDLNALLSEIAEMVTMNKSLKSGTKQILDLRSASQISGHRDKLKQAFLNIVINAYQAMNDSPQPEIVIQTFDEDGKVVVKVKDRGCGMDEIGLRKLFEPFHTTKPKGTGLGMAVTHKIIDNHAGKIFVESAKGVGTEFTIEFPTKDVRRIDKNALADSERASENFSIAFRGQKRGNG
jgi:two-component system sensor histidine kinase PilS (NtrC family)